MASLTALTARGAHTKAHPGAGGVVHSRYPALVEIESARLLVPFLEGLGFIHANDHCRRNCQHCPAYGDRSLPVNMPFQQLRELVSNIGVALADHGMVPRRTIASWRISDPLDYFDATDGEVRSSYDVAALWRDHLGQGLYLVTNGSEGRARARTVLQRLVAEPEFLAQAKLTVTPFDAQWSTERYVADMAADVRVLAPLWELPSARNEDPSGLRFRVNIKVTAETRTQTLEVFERILQAAGFAASDAVRIITDERRVRVKPVYDLGAAFGDSPVAGAVKLHVPGGDRYKPTEAERDRYQYAVYPNGDVRIVDMYAFRVQPAFTNDGRPLRVVLT